MNGEAAMVTVLFVDIRDFTPRGAIELKGKPPPVAVYALGQAT